MASNYYASTQAQCWTFSKTELKSRQTALATDHVHLHTKYPLPDHRLLRIYLQQNIVRLGRRMQLRQQALATAQVYLKRFYLRVEIRRTNPYLVMATAVYLACKMEECPQHIRVMLGEAARQWPELGVTETSKIGECEFALISTLESRLILHHPYRSLVEIGQLFGLSSEELALANNIVNDSYNTNLALLYPPHIIAITAIFLALVLRPPTQPSGMQNYTGSISSSMPATPLQSPGGAQSYTPRSLGGPAVSAAAAQNLLIGSLQASLKQAGPKLAKLVDWLAESNIDMAAIVDATQEMISLYEVWEQYNERYCKEAIAKFMPGVAK